MRHTDVFNALFDEQTRSENLKKDPFVTLTSQTTRTSMTAFNHHKTDLLSHTVTRKWSYNSKNVSHGTPMNKHFLNIKITPNYSFVNFLFQRRILAVQTGRAESYIQREKSTYTVKSQATYNI